MNDQTKRANARKFTLGRLLLGVSVLAIVCDLGFRPISAGANEANSEAKLYAGVMNRAQQAYYIEKNGFTKQLDQLGLAIGSETEGHFYVISNQGDFQECF